MDHVTELERRLELLEARVMALELEKKRGEEQSERVVTQVNETAAPYTADSDRADTAIKDPLLWKGLVTYEGRISAQVGEVNWQMNRPAEGLIGLLEAAPEQLARVISALGHPMRLAVLRQLLNGPLSSQKLQEALGVSSPGQLYHHLRELLSAGVIEQHGRSAYALPARNIVPVLAMLAIVFDLSGMEKDGT